jgi:acetyltransferase-like isoleucine patch superfamily enzyme
LRAAWVVGKWFEQGDDGKRQGVSASTLACGNAVEWRRPRSGRCRSDFLFLRRWIVSRISLDLSAIGYILSRLQRKLVMKSIYRSTIHKTSKVEPGSQVVNSSFGRHSFCGYDCTIINADIGSFCSIAQNVVIGGSAHPMHFVSTSPAFLAHRDSIKTKYARHHYYHLPRTIIGNDVWIGYGAMVRAGTNIGHGAVIGMGSVVTHDVPPYTIVAGNPARAIRERFAPEVRDRLLKSEWWNFSDEELRRCGPNFHDPNLFLEMVT